MGPRSGQSPILSLLLLLCLTLPPPPSCLLLGPHRPLSHLLLLTPITTRFPGRRCMKTRRDSQFPCPYLDIPGLPGGFPTHLSTPQTLQACTLLPPDWS